jgi:hypothetical protein
MHLIFPASFKKSILLFKKIKRLFYFFFYIFLLKIIKLILSKINYIFPDFHKDYLNGLKYDESGKAFYFDNKKIKINKIIIDTSNFYSELCKLCSISPTDKSPYNPRWHRHGYTGLYELLFSSFKNTKFNLAEIGVKYGGSLKALREYFPKAKLCGFDIDKSFIHATKSLRLKSTKVSFMDVSNPEDIYLNLKKFNCKFKIIIDDSSHEFEHQINIINQAVSFLESGGFLIIEDVNNYPGLEKEYLKEIFKEKLKFFRSVFFVECNHINKSSKGMNNDKLLILQKI